MTMTLDTMRADFEFHAGRSLSLPLAGLATWTVIGLVALFLSPAGANLALMVGTGAIFPVAMIISRRLGERLVDNPSPLAGLMGRSVAMVNLLWVLHLSLLVRAPEYLPLSLGIGLGLHWTVFGWVIGHQVGLIHAIVRTGLATALWWAVPSHRVTAVAAAVVIAYGYSVSALSTRRQDARVPVDQMEVLS